MRALAALQRAFVSPLVRLYLLRSIAVQAAIVAAWAGGRAGMWWTPVAMAAVAAAGELGGYLADSRRRALKPSDRAILERLEEFNRQHGL